MAAHARATRAEAELETEKHAMEQALSASRKGLDSQLQQAFESTQMELDDVRESAARVRSQMTRPARAENVG